MVSVIIPVRNGGAKFRACLSGVAALHPAPSAIIVVVDGGGAEDTRAATDIGAEVLQTETTRGPAHARNVGARHASTEIVLFLDADVVPAPDLIARVTENFTQHPRLAALFGSYDEAPSEPNFLSQYKNLLHHYTHQMGRQEACTFWAGCGAIRRDIFLAMGGFDESYARPCIEDIELGYRLRAAGHGIRLCKDIRVQHQKRWGPLSLLRSDFFDRALPWAQLILNDRQAPNDLNLGTASRLSIVLVYLLLIAVVGGVFWRPALLAVPVLPMLLLVLNARFYRFLAAKRGVFFALRAVPWHWFYYFYGGLAFAFVLARHFYTMGRPDRPARQPCAQQA